MRIRKLFSIILVIVLLMPSMFLSTSAEEEEVRGTAPPLNEQTGKYEISTSDHLLYLSGTWKDDAPRDGDYVLLNDIDMAGIEDFLPIASQKKEGYLGTFDGQYNAIRNLKVHYTEKYVGLFGYVGNENDQAYIKDLALLDCDILGKQNVGGLVGVCYGTVTGCIVTGKVEVDREASNAHTGGGIAGKVKEGEGPIIGHVENCYVDGDILAPYDVGGIAGIQDGGGYIGHCYATGTIEATLSEHSGGGIVGSFNAGEHLTSCVATQTSISGKNDMDLIVGQLADESGANIMDNLAWEGIQLKGNEPADHPNKPTYTAISGEELLQQKTYQDIGWDFDTDWQWVETADGGYPLPAGFDTKIISAPTYNITVPQIIHYHSNKVNQNEDAVISAHIATNSAVDSVKVFYGNDPDGNTFDQSVEMTEADGMYSGKLPTDVAGDMYYYIQAVTGGETVTRPYHIDSSFHLYIDDGSIKGDPEQITITLGEKQGDYRFSWITEPQVTKSVLQYKIKDGDEWTSVEGDGFLSYITEGWKEKYSHKADVTGLPEGTDVVYRVGDGEEFMSPEVTFKTAGPAEDGFTFLIMSDPQSVTVEDYESFKRSTDYASTLEKADFLLLPGDITQDGYKASEWESCFEVMQDYFSQMPIIALPGNHEMKGDWDFINFVSRFNMPGGDSGTAFDNTMGSFEIGDACIIIINTEVTPPEEKDAIITKQLDWAKKTFENSDKKWRIMATHAGPYTSNHPTDEVKHLLAPAADDMQVDFFVNGHDHIYIRGTVKDDTKVALGEGTTYLTAGTVGNKYYGYLPASDIYTDFYCDDEDQQIFSLVTVTSDSITAKAYQRSPENEETEEIDWNDWSVIDEYTIPNALHVQAEGTEPPAEESSQAESSAPEEDKAGGSNTTVIVVVVIAVVVVAAVVIILLNRKKEDE